LWRIADASAISRYTEGEIKVVPLMTVLFVPGGGARIVGVAAQKSPVVETGQ
jgi:hypothetical protein